MMNVARIIVSGIVRQVVQYCFRGKLFLYIVVLLTLALALDKATAQELKQYQFRGVYSTETLLLKYCEDCWLELPPDYLKTELVLSVNSNTEKDLFRALQTASKAAGWVLTRDGKKLRAEPLQNAGNVVYISCMDNQPKNVPKYMYAASIEADKIQCAKRDSLLNLAAHSADSSRRVADSIRSVPPLDFRNYELRYYAYSKSFTDKIGVQWSDVLASGNLHDKFRIYDDWKLYATANNDTTFNYRAMYFSLDSTLNVDWGSEEQVLQKSYLTDGVVTSDYEWRKYGIIIKIQREGRRVKMEYTFRDKDNSVSVLQGSVVGLDGDTLFLQGNYNASRVVQNGVPLLCEIPWLGMLFSTTNTITDLKEFELYLIPQQKEVLDTLSTRSVERVTPIYKQGGNDERNDKTSEDGSKGNGGGY